MRNETRTVPRAATIPTPTATDTPTQTPAPAPAMCGFTTGGGCRKNGNAKAPKIAQSSTGAACILPQSFWSANPNLLPGTVTAGNIKYNTNEK